ncbi:MAG: NUDIX hydrolase [Armatimonadota bacterium]
MELKEETIDSRIAFEGRLIKLRVDTVRLPSGRQSTREVVVHRGAVAAVPMLDSDRIVMVRQFRQAAGEILLELPAGTLEANEEPVHCVSRELEEEIGYKAGKLTPLFCSYLAPGYSSEMLHMFLAENLEKIQARPEDDEFIDIVEVSIDDAVELIRSGGIKDAKTICGIMMAQKIR